MLALDKRKITIIDKSMFSTSWKIGGIFVVRANNGTANFITKLTFPGNEIVSFQLFSHFPVKPLFPITRDRENFSCKIPSCCLQLT